MKRLHIVTWNVSMAEPPADVTSLLQLESNPDLYVIGLQELRATPVKYISDLIGEDSWSLLLMNTLAPNGLVKVTAVRMQGLLLIIFAKQAHLPFIRDIRTTYTRTGLFGYWGNKGGVSARLSFYGHLLCFLNCHLAPHVSYASQRLDEFEYILLSQVFDPHDTPCVLDHRVVFWLGDLNFRIADHGLHFLRSAISRGCFSLLWDKDELIMMKKKEPLLQEFQEGPLHFKPTYKFELNSEYYDTSPQKTWFGFIGKKQKPAWTDRILWRIKPKGLQEEEGSSPAPLADHPDVPLKITQDLYTCSTSYGVSDHKPVISTFNLELHKKMDMPLVCVSTQAQCSTGEHAGLTYTILENFEASTRDWIGLYKLSMRMDDHMLAGEYTLGYFCRNAQSLVGLSPAFQIMESKLKKMNGSAT